MYSLSSFDSIRAVGIRVPAVLSATFEASIVTGVRWTPRPSLYQLGQGGQRQSVSGIVTPPGCPQAAALWAISQVRAGKSCKKPFVLLQAAIQHQRHQDTFYLPQELLPDPFKETPQHDTGLTKMSAGTYLRDVLRYLLNFRVVCWSTLRL